MHNHPVDDVSAQSLSVNLYHDETRGTTMQLQASLQSGLTHKVNLDRRGHNWGCETALYQERDPQVV